MKPVKVTELFYLCYCYQLYNFMIFIKISKIKRYFICLTTGNYAYLQPYFKNKKYHMRGILFIDQITLLNY